MKHRLPILRTRAAIRARVAVRSGAAAFERESKQRIGDVIRVVGAVARRIVAPPAARTHQRIRAWIEHSERIAGMSHIKDVTEFVRQMRQINTADRVAVARDDLRVCRAG